MSETVSESVGVLSCIFLILLLCNLYLPCPQNMLQDDSTATTATAEGTGKSTAASEAAEAAEAEADEFDDSSSSASAEEQDEQSASKPTATVPPALAMRQRFRNTPTTFSAQAMSWLGGIRSGILLYAQGDNSLEAGEGPDVVPIGY